VRKRGLEFGKGRSESGQTASPTPDLAMAPAVIGSARPPAALGLYDPRQEHDACGLVFIAHIYGR
jgi:hypothetical protein